MQAMTIEDVLKATGGTLLSGDIHQTFNDVISDSRKVTAGGVFITQGNRQFGIARVINDVQVCFLCRLSVKSLTVTNL